MTPVSVDAIHIVQICGTVFYVDVTTRKEIEALLRRASETGNYYDAITVDTLDGAEVLVIANSIGVIWSSTVESRAREYEITQAIRGEQIE